MRCPGLDVVWLRGGQPARFAGRSTLTQGPWVRARVSAEGNCRGPAGLDVLPHQALLAPEQSEDEGGGLWWPATRPGYWLNTRKQNHVDADRGHSPKAILCAKGRGGTWERWQ